MLIESESVRVVISPFLMLIVLNADRGQTCPSCNFSFLNTD